MARRFTDTRKRRMAWYRQLPLRLKLLWDTLCDECDHAGFWDEDYETISGLIGERVSREDLAVFGSRIVRIKPDRIWIKRFVEFQYGVGLGAREGKLNPKNNAHKGVIKLLEANGIDSTPWIQFMPNAGIQLIHAAPELIPSAAPNEDLGRSCLAPQDKDKNKDKVKEEGGSGGETSQNLNPASPAPGFAQPESGLAVAAPEQLGLMRKWFRFGRARPPAEGGPHV